MAKLTTGKMIRGPIAAAVLLALGLSASSASAQTLEDALRFSSRQPMTGVRSLGMAGAGVAGIADYSAMYSNPAGLGYFRSSGFSGSLSLFSTEDRGVFTGPSTNALDNRDRQGDLGHLAYVHKIPTYQGALVVAVGINQVQSFSRELYYSGLNDANSVTDFFMPLPSEFEIETNDGADGIPNTADDEFTPVFDRDLSFIAFEMYAIDLDVDAFEAGAAVPFFPAVTTGTVEQTGTVREQGSMHEINFGFAAQATRNVMLGVSLNVPVGRWELERFATEVDINNDNDGSGGTVDFESLEWTQTVQSELIGVNARAGVSVRTQSGFRAGATLETPTYYSVSEDYATILTTRFDDGYTDTYGDGFNEDIGSGSYDYSVTSPWRLGLGVGYSKDQLRVMVDAEMIDWSELEMDSDGTAFVDENRFIAQNLEDVLNVRAGVEYDFGALTVRAGAASLADPRRASYSRLDNGDDRAHGFLTAGLSYKASNQFIFDLGWTGEQFNDEFVTYGVTGAPVVTEDVIRGRLAIGFRAKL